MVIRARFAVMSFEGAEIVVLEFPSFYFSKIFVVLLQRRKGGEQPSGIRQDRRPASV